MASGAALTCLVLSYSAALADRSPQECDEPSDLFGQVWQLVRDEFYDPQFNGVNWEQAKQRYEPQVRATADVEQRAAVINVMLGLLNTSHTHLYTRWDREYYQLLDIFSIGSLGEQIRRLFPDGQVRYTGIGIITKRIDDAVFISGVLEGTPAHQAGLQRGQRIVAVDGVPFHPIRSFAGKAGSTVTLTIQDLPDRSSRRDVELVAEDIRPNDMFLEALKRSVRLIPMGDKRIGYAHLWSYAGPQYQEALEQEIAFGKLKEADALILDIRDGWGGGNPADLNLFNQKVPTMTHIRRDKTETLIDFQWRKPAAMLINEGSRSGKELIAYGFKKHNLGVLVGMPTAGAVTGGKLIILDDQAILYLAVLDVRVDGERLEGIGVTPDVRVANPLPYSNGADPQLDRAVQLLANP